MSDPTIESNEGALFKFPNDHRGGFYKETPSVPIYDSAGKKLNFGLVEVGCKPNGKVKQLLGKMDLLSEIWRDRYQPKHGWSPTVARVLTHYHPDRAGGWESRHRPNLVVQYLDIPPEMLASLTQEERKKLVDSVPANSREILEGILEEADSEKLQRMIVDGGGDGRTSTLRGKMAEALVLQDIKKVKPEEMGLWANGVLKYFNERYPRGTEVDGILTFHGSEAYWELAENLGALNHVSVHQPWN
jgi:hypothetical protein